MRQRRIWTLFVLFVALVTLVACGTFGGEGDSTEEGTIPDAISCEVYYRPAAGASLDGTNLSLSTAGDQETLEYDDLRFEATFLSDVGEGQSLSIAVTDLMSGDELARGLYQFDSQNGVSNQFIGGHGFTGLAYVYHPNSEAELQYFCSAGP